MAGQIRGEFRELVTPFLTRKLAELERLHGSDSEAYRAVALQYLRAGAERKAFDWERPRHYDAVGELAGVERLYRRTVLLVLTTACAAHCRWCLRGRYDENTLAPEEIEAAARHFGSDRNRDDLREVLITGGDPFVARKLLASSLEAIARFAPNIRVVRIGTRVPFQAPHLVDEGLVKALASRASFRVEIGLHVNHPIEFWDESVDAVKRLRDGGMLLYNQNPLLRGVNDRLEVLLELYDRLRDLGIESHYLMHCVPMEGMSRHRTTVAEGLELMARLTSSGAFSGRSKPKYVALTDVGKISLGEQSPVRRSGDRLLLKSGYRLDDRLRWNPSWRMPASASVDTEGYLDVWYPDASVSLDCEVNVRRQVLPVTVVGNESRNTM